MSLLEDVFLEDEAGEAQELERVIEGDEFDERPRSDSDDNSEKEGEAEEEKRRVDPSKEKTKRVIKNPRFILNPARLTGPRGIQVIPDHFKDFKFKGKGHEKEDLEMVLKKLEHWAYRLYPKFQFEDCLKKIEMLGKKRPVMVHLQKIRSDQFISEVTVVQKDSSDDEPPPPEDEFDKLLQQQIDLARATPAPGSIKKPMAFSTPVVDNRSITMPKATSSPSITEEQKERMLRNRKLAEERRIARLQNNENQVKNNISTNENTENESNIEVGIVRKHNRSNIIDSSDSEDDNVLTINESITVDIHDKIERNSINNEAVVFTGDRMHQSKQSDEDIIELDNFGKQSDNGTNHEKITDTKIIELDNTDKNVCQKVNKDSMDLNKNDLESATDRDAVTVENYQSKNDKDATIIEEINKNQNTNNEEVNLRCEFNNQKGTSHSNNPNQIDIRSNEDDTKIDEETSVKSKECDNIKDNAKNDSNACDMEVPGEFMDVDFNDDF